MVIAAALTAVVPYPAAASFMSSARTLLLPGPEPNGRQVRFVWWALCIDEPEQTFTSTNHSSGGWRRRKAVAPGTALAPVRVSQAWGADLAQNQEEMACRSGDARSPRLTSCHIPLPTPPTRGIKIEPKAQPVDLE